jgi:hypothetical protein
MTKKEVTELDDTDRNPDPLSGESGAHPAGVTAGAVTGVAVGAAFGSLAGPLGTALGAAVGTVAGALAGRDVAEDFNPTVETDYWRERYVSRPYVRPGDAYELYEPAYRRGWEAYRERRDGTFDDVESDLKHAWERSESAEALPWDRAREASRDAWQRMADSQHDPGL